MKKTYSALQFVFIGLCLICVNLCSAQKQTNKWYFGTLAGLDFNTSPPTVLANGLLNTNEGTASVSDATGSLLFYTDGVDVRNNTHAVMPNGTGLLGDVSTTQSALIVKKPGSSTLYYIFTLPAEGLGSFCYSIVDMSLDNGKGDVTTKNTVVKSNVTEKMSAVYHCNGTDVWVTIHELNTNKFYSYLVSSAGVGPPVVSSTGRVFTKVHAQMKFNTKGTMLAVIRDTILQNSPYLGKSYTDICQFNNQTGVITYSLTLLNGTWQNSYGLEFSPDNSKLYVSSYDQSGINGGNSAVTQYNLAATNIQGSAISVGTSTDPNILRAMQLASDGKIYVSKSISPFLCVIHTPNAPGALCSYTDNAVNIDPNGNGAMCMLGLPGFIQNYLEPSFPTMAICPIETGITSRTTNKFTLSYDPSNEMLHLYQMTTDSYCEVVVSDIQGKILSRKSITVNTEGSALLSVSTLPQGLFIVSCIDGTTMKVVKFIKPE